MPGLAILFALGETIAMSNCLLRLRLVSVLLALVYCGQGAYAQPADFLNDYYENRLNPTEFKRSIKDLNARVERTPEDFNLRMKRGYVHAFARHWDAALGDFTAANRIAPERYEPIRGQAWLMACMNRLKNALTLYNKAIEMAPKNGKLYFERGLVQANIPNFRASIEDSDRAIALGYRERNVYLQKAKSTFYEGDAEKAVKILDSIPGRKPPQNREYDLKTDFLLVLGRYEEALKTAENRLAIPPASVGSLLKVAECQIKLRRYKEALVNLNKAIALHPTTADPYIRRAAVYRKLGMNSQAQADQKMVEKINSSRHDL